MTDGELVARARDGDHAAFGELVDRHRTAVYRAALAALSLHADAEDAAQDAFVLAWRRLGSFRGDASFKTWLLTIAWHQAINRRRSLVGWWRRTVQVDAETVDAGIPAPYVASGRSPALGAGFCRTTGFDRSSNETPEQLLAKGRLRNDIRRAIRALSPKLRDALLLAQSGDYSYEEIGAMLKAPLGTIKWRVLEARRGVKKALRERGYDDVG